MPTPQELAAQRAEEEQQQGTVDTTIVAPARPSPTDWGELRGPADPHGDGGVSVVSLPKVVPALLDTGGFDAETHPASSPFKHLLDKPEGELSDEERALLFTELAARERARQDARDQIALEQERFSLEKKRSSFALVRGFAIGFGIFATAAFSLLVGVLLYISVKNQSFNDSSVITSILNTFSNFFQILAGM